MGRGAVGGAGSCCFLRCGALCAVGAPSAAAVEGGWGAAELGAAFAEAGGGAGAVGAVGGGEGGGGGGVGAWAGVAGGGGAAVVSRVSLGGV